MPDVTKLKPLGTLFCKQYGSEAEFYLDLGHSSGRRHLIVRYGDGHSGRTDLPIVDGRRQFAAAVPAEWTEQDVQHLLLWPMKSPDAPCPAWEVAARVYGSPELFRWWAGEKPR